MATFSPRLSFPSSQSLPRSYFLGHHRSSLTKMKSMLSSIDLIIECRDYRVPLTSRNPMFEESLAGRERLILYTKRDLGRAGNPEDEKRESTIRSWHYPSAVFFSDHRDSRSTRKIIQFISKHSTAANKLTGTSLIVVGMPNVGKSTILNALRRVGVQKGKAARTGAQPGVTRKMGTSVKIIERTERHEGVYLLDTPGVFVPYMPNAESMLKLALCGSVKDSIINPVTLADYLLFQLNLRKPHSYSEYSPPTNDIIPLLKAVARKTGRLHKGGKEDEEAAAMWLIQRWRVGHLGKVVLDVIDDATLERWKKDYEIEAASVSQAKKVEREVRRQRALQRHIDTGLA